MSGALAVILGSVLIFSGAAKLRWPDGLIETLMKEGVGRNHTTVIVRGVSLAEIVLGAAVALRVQEATILPILVLAMIVFTAYSVRNQLLGRSYDCGCFGAVKLMSSQRQLVLRNLTLTVLSLALTVNVLY